MGGTVYPFEDVDQFLDLFADGDIGDRDGGRDRRSSRGVIRRPGRGRNRTTDAAFAFHVHAGVLARPVMRLLNARSEEKEEGREQEPVKARRCRRSTRLRRGRAKTWRRQRQQKRRRRQSTDGGDRNTHEESNAEWHKERQERSNKRLD
ncbi:hypothetical protein TGVAND_435440 [Toxoplasma gondii VAND]|uniref:Uncharacterized protein n=1 Tax=Toxoplasma gondii VAND TaxID=933077 RepID=A0A086QK22_TOXGO|nr:hypothetical protein TGVAND_435440 [Toxoplasma gondii VAND]